MELDSNMQLIGEQALLVGWQVVKRARNDHMGAMDGSDMGYTRGAKRTNEPRGSLNKVRWHTGLLTLHNTFCTALRQRLLQ